MEEIVIYLLKSSGLMAAFFIAYHFLLRKETFFTSNRWFLLSGLGTSILLPMFFFTKIIYVEKPKISLQNLNFTSTNATIISDDASSAPIENFDWYQLMTYVYIIIVLILFIKLLINIISLLKIVSNKQIQNTNDFSYIDINQSIAPFSFFNFIVLNSSLYSHQELESILLHEKVHSQEKHSIDVLVIKIVTIVFWFNPFVWMYKKAIVQNLEYIADSKAMQHIEDKKCYQMTLLKVVSHQNSLPITNHFYQSLIKKRIVMLNQNQSSRKNNWKYSLVIPLLIAFVYFFQIKVIAQEKLIPLTDGGSISSSTREVTEMNWTKNSPDEEFNNDTESLKKSGINMLFSNIKRNENNENTEITIAYRDKFGNNETKYFSGKDGIAPIYFKRDMDQNGKGEIGFYDKNPFKNKVEVIAVGYVLDKNSTDAEIQNDVEMLKKQQDIDYKISNLKRNSKGEIIAIKIEFEDKKGNVGTTIQDNNKPIEPIHFTANIDENGKGKIGFYESELSKTENSFIAASFDKNESDSEIDKKLKIFIDEGITFKKVKTKRNSDNEIISIQISGKSKKNNYDFNSNSSEPIDEIYLIKEYGISNKLTISEKKDLKTAFASNKVVVKTFDYENEPPTPPTPPVAPMLNIHVEAFPNMPKAPTAPKGNPITNEKEWKKFEKKMDEFEKKMKAIEPTMEAYTEKISKIDEQMKPFEKEMEAFEKKMEIFEKEMELYQEKMQAIQERGKTKK